MSSRLYRFQTKRPQDDISQWLAFIWEVGVVADERGVDNPFNHAPVHVDGPNFKEVYPDAQVIHPMRGTDEGVRILALSEAVDSLFRTAYARERWVNPKIETWRPKKSA